MTFENLRVLSVKQPWAELIARGDKSVELRTWPTNYRGPLLIHASAGRVNHPLIVDRYGKIGELGVALCLIMLEDCRPARRSDAAAAGVVGRWSPTGEWAWLLASPVRVPGVPLKGNAKMGKVPALPELVQAFSRYVARPG
jgi:hypothetical protein